MDNYHHQVLEFVRHFFDQAVSYSQRFFQTLHSFLILILSRSR